jgi:hypothetical protein
MTKRIILALVGIALLLGLILPMKTVALVAVRNKIENNKDNGSRPQTYISVAMKNPISMTMNGILGFIGVVCIVVSVLPRIRPNNGMQWST